ncbi:hypothetical protein ACTXT7_015474 [Hymenolepis weldensis]
MQTNRSGELSNFRYHAARENSRNTASSAATTLKDTYGNDVVNKKTCRRWFSRFRKDDFSLKDKRRTESRMLKKLHSEQLQVATDENPTCTT